MVTYDTIRISGPMLGLGSILLWGDLSRFCVGIVSDFQPFARCALSYCGLIRPYYVAMVLLCVRQAWQPYCLLWCVVFTDDRPPVGALVNTILRPFGSVSTPL